MGRVCDICGRKPVKGNRITRSGLAKSKGGIGLHTGGITRRTFHLNLHRIKVDQNGTIKRLQVCSRCVKAGKIKRPSPRPKQVDSSEA